MLRETEVKAAEDLTAALNNFNGLTQEVIEENKAALKQELDGVIAAGFDNETQKLQTLIDTGKSEIDADKIKAIEAIDIKTNDSIQRVADEIDFTKAQAIEDIASAKENLIRRASIEIDAAKEKAVGEITSAQLFVNMFNEAKKFCNDVFAFADQLQLTVANNKILSPPLDAEVIETCNITIKEIKEIYNNTSQSCLEKASKLLIKLDELIMYWEYVKGNHNDGSDEKNFCEAITNDLTNLINTYKTKNAYYFVQINNAKITDGTL